MATPRTRQLLALAASCIASLVLLEVALRWLTRDQRVGYHLRPRGETSVFEPTPDVMPGIVGDSQFRVNSMGIRGDEIPEGAGVTRVLCIGGSTTECLYLDQAESWPERVEALLSAGGRSFWVGNVGRSGFATPHHLAFLRHSEVIDRVDAVVLLLGVNDFMLFLRGFDFAAEAMRQPARRRFERPLITQLSAVRLGRAERAGRGVLIEDEGGQGYPARRRRRRTSPLVAGPDLAAALEQYRRRLDDLVAAARERGVTPYFATQPVLWDASLDQAARDLLWMGRVPDRGYLAVEELRAGIERYNAVLLDACSDHGLDCVDLSALHGSTKYFYDDCHFNEAGAREVANRLAAVLTGVVPRRRSPAGR